MHARDGSLYDDCAIQLIQYAAPCDILVILFHFLRPISLVFGDIFLIVDDDRMSAFE
jgi:hypothetical protein